MEPPRLPPELNDHLTEEILLRVAPDEPASLFRASVVCRLWHRILSDPDFRRRYRAFHRGAPLLGFFYNLDFQGPSSSYRIDLQAPFSRFVATTSASSLAKAAATHDDRHVSRALDCRHGRVLFEKVGSRKGLAVWDPIADDWTELPPPKIPFASYSAVVLCDVAGCDHRDCCGGRFLVVCVGLCNPPYLVSSCVYSSEDRAWRVPVSNGSGPWRPCRQFDKSRPALIGDGIYCSRSGAYWILKYDLVQRRLSWITMPFCYYHKTDPDPVLMQNEDGSLGLAGIRDSTLNLWSLRWPTQGATAEWVEWRIIKLSTILPLHDKPCTKANVIGFAEGVGVFFIRTNVGVFTLELKSGRVMKVGKPGNNYCTALPFISFFTPDCAS